MVHSRENTGQLVFQVQDFLESSMIDLQEFLLQGDWATCVELCPGAYAL